MKILTKALIPCALLAVLVAPTACKKSDSSSASNVTPTPKVTTPSVAKQISGAHHWHGVSYKGYNSCAGTYAPPNDTDFSITYLNDSMVSVWNAEPKLFSNGLFVSPWGFIITLEKRNDIVYFSCQTPFLGCYYITTYCDTL